MGSRNIVATEEVLDVVGTCNALDKYEVTDALVAETLGISRSTAKRHLLLLVERGWVRKSGQRPTFWLVTPEGRVAHANDWGF